MAPFSMSCATSSASLACAITSTSALPSPRTSTVSIMNGSPLDCSAPSWRLAAARSNAALAGSPPLAPPQPHVERAGAAMSGPRLLEAEHDRAQVGIAQPVRDEAAQHALLAEPGLVSAPTPTLARDDDDQAELLRLRLHEKAAQRRMGFGLGHAVQVEHAVDRWSPAREIALEASLQRGERLGRWRRGWRRGRRGGGGLAAGWGGLGGGRRGGRGRRGERGQRRATPLGDGL